MMTIGYARVSTGDQDAGMQERLLREAGAERVYVDHAESSRRRDRPQWLACLDHAREGDTLLVYRLDRVAGGSMLLQAVLDLGDRGIGVRSLTEPMFDTSGPMGRAVLGMFAVINQYRLDVIRQNTLDGLARARAEGRTGGRPSVQTPERMRGAAALRRSGESLRAIARQLGVSESTVRRMLASAAGSGT